MIKARRNADTKRSATTAELIARASQVEYREPETVLPQPDPDVTQRSPEIQAVIDQFFNR